MVAPLVETGTQSHLDFRVERFLRAACSFALWSTSDLGTEISRRVSDSNRLNGVCSGPILLLGWPAAPESFVIESGRLRFTNQFGVGQPLANNRRHRSEETRAIIGFALVEPEYLLIQIAEQMEWFDADVRSSDAPLEQTPEVF